MSPIRPLEVLLLSLVGPLCLAAIFLFFPPWRGSPGVEVPRSEAPRSRSGPVATLGGTLPGGESVRVFAGLAPGLGEGLPLQEAARRFGGPGREALLTLLLCNQTGQERKALAGTWLLRQGDRPPWRLLPDPTAAGPREQPIAALFTPEGAVLPSGRVARHLFAGPERPSAEEPAVLEGPGGLLVPLEPASLPAHRVMLFSPVEEQRG